MRILFVCALAVGALSATGCFNTDNMSDPITDKMAQTPLMYKPDIQQGNVISQEQVNRLEPGMSRDQVRYLMGTPMLVDTFHQNRWDYVFTMKKGGGEVKKERVSLYFKDDQLVRIEGNYRPQPNSEPPAKDIVVTVPDHGKKKSGIVDKTLKAVGFIEKTPNEEMEEKTDVQQKETAQEGSDDTSNEEEVEKEADEAADPTALPEPEKADDAAAETAAEEVEQE